MTRKQAETPNAARRRPPIAGPTARAALLIAVFKATAFATDSCPTICFVSVWRPGLSSEFTQPTRKAATQTIQICTTCPSARLASEAARRPFADCVKIRRRRGFQRSTVTPASGPKRRSGVNWSAVVMPSARPPPPRRMTSQFSATSWTHVPDDESDCPTK